MSESDKGISPHLRDTLSVDQAIQMQFDLVDVIANHFTGSEILQSGDFGLASPNRMPKFTKKVEECLADFFGGKAAVLTRGGGTGAIRYMLSGVLKPGDRIIVNDAPLFPTTKNSLDEMNIQVTRIDYNKTGEIGSAIREETKGILIVHSYDKVADAYDLEKIIELIKSSKFNPIIMTDESYAAMHSQHIGVKLGADLSAFSLFKLFGPPGISIVLAGTERGVRILEKVRGTISSGGTIVQGPEAMDVLRSIVHAPVMQAISNRVIKEVVDRINNGEIEGVRRAYASDVHLRHIVVELTDPIDKKVMDVISEFGACTWLVGAESRYEIAFAVNSKDEIPEARIYQEANPELEGHILVVIPFRAGADTIIRVLKQGINNARS